MTPSTSPPSPGHVLKLDFVGADPVRPVGTERAPGVVSYFTGPEENWLTGVPTFSSITYPDLWPGIDLVYEGTGSSLEYTFHLDPGADPDRIRLRYRGASGLDLTPGGTLEISTPLGGITEQPPITYQGSPIAPKVHPAASFPPPPRSQLGWAARIRQRCFRRWLSAGLTSTEPAPNVHPEPDQRMPIRKGGGAQIHDRVGLTRPSERKEGPCAGSLVALTSPLCSLQSSSCRWEELPPVAQ